MWLESYKKPTVSENTYLWSYKNTCEKHLFPYFKNADLRAIQPAHIQKFFNEHQHLSESMLSKLNMCLIGIFASAVENDKCYKNPALSKNVAWQSGKEKQEKRVYADEQISTLTALAELPEIVALLWTGMRIGELCGLMWQDVDMQNDVYTIQRSIAVKAGGGVEVRPPKWNSTRTQRHQNDNQALRGFCYWFLTGTSSRFVMCLPFFSSCSAAAKLNGGRFSFIMTQKMQPC